MSIASVWEKATGISIKRKGGSIDTLHVPPFILKALRVSRTKDAKDECSVQPKRIVCVHGLGSSGSAYGGLLPLLSSHWHDIWAPSAPSHGMSPPIPPELFDSPKIKVERSDSTLEEAQLHASEERDRFQSIIYQAWERTLLSLSEESPIDVLGVSLGGAVAIRFSARYPERVSSLMLCSPAGAVLDQEDIAHLKSVFRMSRPGDGLRFLKTLYHQVPWWGPLLAPLVRLSLNRPEAQELINRLKPGDGIKAEEFSALAMPVLLIWGGRERVLPESILNRLIENAPRRLTVLRPEHFSHTPQKEEPKLLMTHLANFQDMLAREAKIDD